MNVILYIGLNIYYIDLIDHVKKAAVCSLCNVALQMLCMKVHIIPPYVKFIYDEKCRFADYLQEVMTLTTSNFLRLQL